MGSLPSQTSLSVADRINELERQQTRYTYLDPEKKHRVSDPTLKAIQKKALLSFYERHHSTSSKSSWRSEPQLLQSTIPSAPHPPPRPQPQTPSRRASCASDYASSLRKHNVIPVFESKTTDNIKVSSKHQHSNSCGSLSTDLLGPVIMGPSISVDDWVPERPPKKPHLRTVYPDLFQEPRIPSPDLPPPSPPVVLEDEVFNNDEPFPPPPSDIETAKWEQESNNKFYKNRTVIPSDNRVNKNINVHSENLSRQNSLSESNSQEHNTTEPKLRHSGNISEGNIKQPNIIEHNLRQSHIRISQRNQPPQNAFDTKTFPCESVLLNSKHFLRSSSSKSNDLSYQQRQSFIDHSKRHKKFIVNGSVAVSQNVLNGFSDSYQTESLRNYKPPLQPPLEDKRKPPAQLPVEIRHTSTNATYPIEFKNVQRSSFAEHTENSVPPPLHPRQVRINRSMRARIPDPAKHIISSKNSPPKLEERREKSVLNDHFNYNW